MKKKKSHKGNVLVTGGAGFIGSHVVDALIDKGYTVHIVDDLSGGKKEQLHSAAFFHKVDIKNKKALEVVFKKLKHIDGLFHLAAQPRVQFSIDFPVESSITNIIGTLNLLDLARLYKVGKVVYSASSAAYGDQTKIPLVEGMHPMPKSPYGFQKYSGEVALETFYQVYGLRGVSLRYFNVYGPRLDPEGAYALVIGRFLKQRKEGKPLTVTGDGKQTRDFTHVRDVARANVQAFESQRTGKGEVINIGTGKEISINTLASMIGGTSVHVESRIEPRRTRADISKAKKLLGWEPTVPFKEGITELKVLFGISE